MGSQDRRLIQTLDKITEESCQGSRSQLLNAFLYKLEGQGSIASKVPLVLMFVR